jgi:XTP/dITP diphosphohydrolase
MGKLIFASSNKNKIAEISDILKDKYLIIGLNDIGYNVEIEETGNTLRENALIKAKTIFDEMNISCFADDSGLMVDALNGAPGVFSARYAGEHGNSEKNMDLLLKNLTGIENRKAHFSTVIALVLNGEQYFFEGKIEGEIIHEKRGEGGFGYDPIFVPKGYDKTFAEMDKSIKNSISHRAIAVKKLVDFLASKI